MPDILFFLFLGHFCGDYALQTDRMAKLKSKSLTILSQHVLIYTIAVGTFWLLGKSLQGFSQLFTLTTLVVLVSIFILHWAQDYLKSRRFNGSKQSYYADQALHLIVLYVVRIFY